MTGTETALEPAATSGKSQLPVEILVPLDIDQLAEAFKKFEEFKSRLLKPEDYQKIGSKQFIKKSGWRKWALACGVSDRLLTQERVPATGKDLEAGFYYRIVVEAYHPSTGRSSTGTAIASSKEKTSWAHEEHDVYTLAHTRAKNRAIADLVGGGEVSAEEVESDELREPKKQPAAPQKADCAWHITADATADQVHQEPIFHKTATVGTLNIDEEHNECAFVPELEIRADVPPISSFLEKKILAAMQQKHPGLDYKIDVVDGRLRAVLVRGALEGDRLKELMDPVGWAFAKAAETKPTGGSS